jgi:hypothetical protein
VDTIQYGIFSPSKEIISRERGGEREGGGERGEREKIQHQKES